MAILDSGRAEAALRELWRRHQPMVRQVVRRVVRDPAVAADTVDEVLEKLYLKREHYQLGTNLKAWLLGVARNHALTVLRQQRRRLDRGIGLDPGGADRVAQLPGTGELGQQAALGVELHQALSSAMNDLAPRYRDVFDLCVCQQVPYREVSERLALPKGTIAIRVRRARQQLFGALARHLDPARVRELTYQLGPAA